MVGEGEGESGRGKRRRGEEEKNKREGGRGKRERAGGGPAKFSVFNFSKWKLAKKDLKSSRHHISHFNICLELRCPLMLLFNFQFPIITSINRQFLETVISQLTPQHLIA